MNTRVNFLVLEFDKQTGELKLNLAKFSQNIISTETKEPTIKNRMGIDFVTFLHLSV